MKSYWHQIIMHSRKNNMVSLYVMSAAKRSFSELEDDDEELFPSKKVWLNSIVWKYVFLNVLEQLRLLTSVDLFIIFRCMERLLQEVWIMQRRLS